MSGPFLALQVLRAANLDRLPAFKDRQGRPAHSQPDGSDWSLGEWMTALTGEVGEAANIIKKVKRGDMTLDEARKDLANELVDILTYLDILAYRCGVDLADHTPRRWNEVSRRVGFAGRIRVAPKLHPNFYLYDDNGGVVPTETKETING